MHHFNLSRLLPIESPPSDLLPPHGGLFLHPHGTLLSLSVSCHVSKVVSFGVRRRGSGRGVFLSVSLSDGNDEGYVRGDVLGQNGNIDLVEFEKENGSGAMNTTKHLWSGAVAAMVSRALQRKVQEDQVSTEEQEEMMRNLARRETEYMRMQRRKIGIDDVEQLTVIRKGAFGNVFSANA